MRLAFIILLTIPLTIFSEQVFALRCGHRIVDAGDSKVKILLRCGAADFSETRERRTPKGCTRDSYYEDDSWYIDRYRHQNCRVEIIEVWTYNFGPTKFMRELIFVEGVLDEINMLGYGY